MAKKGWRSANLSPDRRVFFGQGRGGFSSREIASRVVRSFGSRGGASTADLNFPLIFAPTLISVTPNTGTNSGGTTVDLAGMNFQPGAAVTFGGVSATVVLVTPTHITATTPAHANGSVDVTVTNPDLQFSTLVNGYLYTGIFVIVGDNAGSRIASSPDGITWTPRVAGVANVLLAVTWNGSIFAAVGDNAATTSPDGITWTARTIPAGSYFAITYDGTNFIAIGNNISATSPDGITWTSHSIPVAATFLGVTSNGTRAVAVRVNQTLTSDDHGVTWTAHSTGPVFGNWQCIAYNSGLFVMGPDGSAFDGATSSDGVTWNAHASPIVAQAVCITFSGSTFVGGTVGSAVALVSPDGGISWVNTVYPPLAAPRGMAFNGAVFAGAGVPGAGKAATSPDGIAWTARELTAGVNCRGMASNFRIGSPNR